MSMSTDSGDEYEYWKNTHNLEYRFGRRWGRCKIGGTKKAKHKMSSCGARNFMAVLAARPALLLATRTLNAKGQSRVTLPLR